MVLGSPRTQTGTHMFLQLLSPRQCSSWVAVKEVTCLPSPITVSPVGYGNDIMPVVTLFLIGEPAILTLLSDT